MWSLLEIGNMSRTGMMLGIGLKKLNGATFSTSRAMVKLVGL